MEETFEFETPISSLKRLLVQDISSRFTIIVNFQNKNKQKDQINFYTTTNKARIISNNINQLCQIDPTINEYSIKIPSKFDSSKEMSNSSEIEQILDYLIKSTEKKIHISNDKFHFFTIIRFLLGEDKVGQIHFQISSEDEAISFLSTDFHEKAVEYLSIHFLEFIKNRKFTNINSEIMKEIIDLYIEIHDKEESNDENKEEEGDYDDYEDEDNKCKKQTFSDEVKTIFYQMLNEDEDTKVILHFLLNLKSNVLSDEMIEYFYEELDDEAISEDLPRIVFLLRSHLSDLIEFNQHRNEFKTRKKNSIEVHFEGNELNGIISYLRRTTNANIHESGDLKLSGGGTTSCSCPLINLTKYDYDHINDYYFNSCQRAPNEKDNWIEFDFGDKKIKLSSYTIRTNLCTAGEDSHPKTWKIVGSNDRENWTLINQQVENNDLNGRYKQHRFECKKKSSYYRYIRYIQEDSWFNNIEFKYKIKLTCIEFFGSILKPVLLL